MRAIIESLSEYVWYRLRDSIDLDIRQGEETLTDNMLLLLARQQRYNITVLRTFIDHTSRSMEARQGTDWEWWIGSYTLGWRRFAVQAKKLNSETHRYDCLTHKVGRRKKPQIDIFEEYCLSNDAEGIYCFYNFMNSALNYKRYWHCVDPRVDPLQLAWTFTPLGNVRLAVNKWGGKNFKYVHSFKDTLPMRCLFSCPSFLDFFNGKSPLPSRL